MKQLMSSEIISFRIYILLQNLCKALKKKKKKNSLGRNAATLTSLTSDRLFITTETQEDCDK